MDTLTQETGPVPTGMSEPQPTLEVVVPRDDETTLQRIVKLADHVLQIATGNPLEPSHAQVRAAEARFQHS